MAVRLGADLSYRGPTCKNPFHPCWETLSSDHLFTLSELHAWLADLNNYPATEGAGDRRGEERRDVRRDEAMGIPGRPGAQGGRRYAGGIRVRLGGG